MSTPKHTPAPWQYSEKVSGMIEVTDQQGRPVMLGTGLKNEKANAQLIAAAPELLAACELILAEVTNLPGTGKQNGSMGWRHIHALRDAVRKATGGAE